MNLEAVELWLAFSEQVKDTPGLDTWFEPGTRRIMLRLSEDKVVPFTSLEEACGFVRALRYANSCYPKVSIARATNGREQVALFCLLLNKHYREFTLSMAEALAQDRGLHAHTVWNYWKVVEKFRESEETLPDLKPQDMRGRTEGQGRETFQIIYTILYTDTPFTTIASDFAVTPDYVRNIALKMRDAGFTYPERQASGNFTRENDETDQAES